RESLACERRTIEPFTEQRVASRRRVSARRECRPGFAQKRLDLSVGVPTLRTLFENQIRAHAAEREVANSVVIFRAVGMGIEMARAVVADVFEELDEPERRFDVCRSEPEVLVVAARRLIVEIDVEQLAGFPRLRDGMKNVEAGHVFMRDFR